MPFLVDIFLEDLVKLIMQPNDYSVTHQARRKPILFGPAEQRLDVGAAREARLLGGGEFWILDHLRSFLVQSWGEIARVGQRAAKPSHYA